MRIRFICLWFAVAGLVTSSCTSLPGTKFMQLSVSKGRPFLILESEKTGWGIANHPYIRWIGEDRLAITYWISGDGAKGGVAYNSWPMYSDDLGRTWQHGDPYNWCDGTPDEIVTQINKGDRFDGFQKGILFGPLIYPCGLRVMLGQYSPSKPHRLLSARSGNGDCWELEWVSFEYPELDLAPAAMVVESPGIVLSNGVAFIAAYVSGRQVHLFKSEDEGRSFQFESVIADGHLHAPWGPEGVNENAILYVPERDEFICVMRTGMQGLWNSAPMLQAHSTDHGATWTNHRKLFPGVMPKLIRMESGILVMAFGRPGNHLMFSTDGGRNWGRGVSITSAGPGTTGYVDVLEVEPGRLLVIYDQIDRPTSRVWLWEPQRINALFGVYVDVHYRGRR